MNSPHPVATGRSKPTLDLRIGILVDKLIEEANQPQLKHQLSLQERFFEVLKECKIPEAITALDCVMINTVQEPR